ncbi:hypothetical protein HAX54_014339, partial [Datura stramonium]|nr:hypothetical protein [Datura stramonium]
MSLGLSSWASLEKYASRHVWTPRSAVHHRILPLTRLYVSAQKISNRDKYTLLL